MWIRKSINPYSNRNMSSTIEQTKNFCVLHKQLPHFRIPIQLNSCYRNRHKRLKWRYFITGHSCCNLLY